MLLVLVHIACAVSQIFLEKWFMLMAVIGALLGVHMLFIVWLGSNFGAVKT